MVADTRDKGTLQMPDVFVVHDAPGRPIELLAYADGMVIARREINAASALSLAQELIAAARPRLSYIPP